MAETEDIFFSPNHKRLVQISATANIFAWLVLIFFVLQAISQYLNFTSQQGYIFSIDMFRDYPESVINFFLIMINIIFKGIVC